MSQLLKIELEVKRIDLQYKRIRYQIETRWGKGGSGMFIFQGYHLIYSTWNKEVNTPEGDEVERAYAEHKRDQHNRMYDLD